MKWFIFDIGYLSAELKACRWQKDTKDKKATHLYFSTLKQVFDIGINKICQFFSNLLHHMQVDFVEDKMLCKVIFSKIVFRSFSSELLSPAKLYQNQSQVHSLVQKKFLIETWSSLVLKFKNDGWRFWSNSLDRNADVITPTVGKNSTSEKLKNFSTCKPFYWIKNFKKVAKKKKNNGQIINKQNNDQEFTYRPIKSKGITKTRQSFDGTTSNLD